MMAYMNTERDLNTHGGVFAQSGSVILRFSLVSPSPVLFSNQLEKRPHITRSLCLYQCVCMLFKDTYWSEYIINLSLRSLKLTLAGQRTKVNLTHLRSRYAAGMLRNHGDDKKRGPHYDDRCVGSAADRGANFAHPHLSLHWSFIIFR